MPTGPAGPSHEESTSDQKRQDVNGDIGHLEDGALQINENSDQKHDEMLPARRVVYANGITQNQRVGQRLGSKEKGATLDDLKGQQRRNNYA